MRNVAITVITILALTQPVQANLITFTNETAFNTAIGGVALTTEGFEAINLVLAGNTGPLNFSDVSVNTVSGIVYGNDDPNFVSEGNRAIDWAQADGNITFTFNSPINAFAIDIKDLGVNDPEFRTTLSVSVSGGAFLPIFGNFTGALGNQLFAGMLDTSTTFTAVTFTNTIEFDAMGLDRLQFGIVEVPIIAVPEPGGFALLLSGLVGLALLRRLA